MDIYILELNKKNKFYIVKTDNIEELIKKYNKYKIKFIVENNGINKYCKTLLKNINIDLLDKYEVIIRLIKYGYNSVRGWLFTHETLKKDDYIKLKKEILEDKNLGKLCNEVNNNWLLELENKIEKEIKKIENTICFNCGRKGHYALYCIEKYNTDGIKLIN